VGWLVVVIVVATVWIPMTSGTAAANEVYWTAAHDLAPQGFVDFMTWGDLDADGDDDICASFQYWNDGGCPGPPVWRSQSCVLPWFSGCSYRQSTLGDLDADGDLDLIHGCSEPVLYMFWNVGTPQAPQWQYAPSTFPGGPYGEYYHTVPRLADLDGDGDLDLIMLVGAAGGRVWFCENTGTPQVPQWGLPCEVIPMTPLPPVASIAVGDLDRDGDLDIIGCTSMTPLQCWENVGTPQDWQFVENPAMLGGVDEPAAGGWGIALPDVDCDGDPDLLVEGWRGPVYLYLNDSISSVTPTTWGTIKALYR
jgi:hypothetical protein